MSQGVFLGVSVEKVVMASSMYSNGLTLPCGVKQGYHQTTVSNTATTSTTAQTTTVTQGSASQNSAPPLQGKPVHLLEPLITL